MTEAPTSRVGPYEILREIGRGGMGVVYAARDSKLDRTVSVASRYTIGHCLPPDDRAIYLTLVSDESDIWLIELD